jgi:hypothetical protein
MNMDEITTIQISVKTKEELSKIGNMSDTYDSVVSRLIHEHYNLNIQPDLNRLKDAVDFPVDKEKNQMTLELFEGILSLGYEVEFVLNRDPKKEPLTPNRNNLVTFNKSKKPLCLVNTGETYVDLYIPTMEEGTKFPGWKPRPNFYKKFHVERELEVIKHLYENL